LAKEVTKLTAEVGASFSFDYMTDTGYEGYSYDYTKRPDLKGVKLKLLDHFGGDPIFAAGTAFKCDGSAYAALVKWVKVAYGHVDDVLMTKLDGDQKDQYTKGKKAFLPLFQKLDDTTSKLLIRAFKDEAALGFVLDAKWKSKKWFKDMPDPGKDLPGLEVGLVLGLSDGDKFAKALKEYRLTINEMIEKARDVGPKDD